MAGDRCCYESKAVGINILKRTRQGDLGEAAPATKAKRYEMAMPGVDNSDKKVSKNANRNQKYGGLDSLAKNKNTGSLKG